MIPTAREISRAVFFGTRPADTLRTRRGVWRVAGRRGRRRLRRITVLRMERRKQERAVICSPPFCRLCGSAALEEVPVIRLQNPPPYDHRSGIARWEIPTGHTAADFVIGSAAHAVCPSPVCGCSVPHSLRARRVLISSSCVILSAFSALISVKFRKKRRPIDNAPGKQ